MARRGEKSQRGYSGSVSHWNAFRQIVQARSFPSSRRARVFSGERGSSGFISFVFVAVRHSSTLR